MKSNRYKELTVTLEGVSPLLMHNGQLANPMNAIARQMKAVSGKRKKTDDDYIELAKLEWMGGLYLDADKRPSIPGECVEAMLVGAAKVQRLGKAFTAGVICDGLWPIKFKGPKDIDALWNDENFRYQRLVRVQQARVLRTRPMFRQWSVDVTIHFMSDVVSVDSLKQAITTAGELIGLGDYRPKFGRFDVAA